MRYSRERHGLSRMSTFSSRRRWKTRSPATTSAVSVPEYESSLKAPTGQRHRKPTLRFGKRGILLIPDFLANAGGVTCSYFEQVQSNMNYFWEKDEVLGKLDLKMTSAYFAVSDLARREKLYMRDAAYAIAIGRVAKACHERGWV